MHEKFKYILIWWTISQVTRYKSGRYFNPFQTHCSKSRVKLSSVPKIICLSSLRLLGRREHKPICAHCRREKNYMGTGPVMAISTAVFIARTLNSSPGQILTDVFLWSWTPSLKNEVFIFIYNELINKPVIKNFQINLASPISLGGKLVRKMILWDRKNASIFGEFYMSSLMAWRFFRHKCEYFAFRFCQSYIIRRYNRE